MTAVIRACVAGAMAGVVLVTTCAVAGPSVAAAQAAPATASPPPPTAAAPAEVAPPVPVEPASPPPPLPAPGSTYIETPPPADTALMPAAPEPIASTPEPPSKLPSYILWGAGAASLIVGAVMGGLALSAKKDFDDNPSYDRADTVDHRALVADVAFGLGIVLAVTGTVFFFAHGHDDQAQQSPQARDDRKVQLSVAPIVTPHAGGGALQVRF